jgi:hypothetical protein
MSKNLRNTPSLLKQLLKDCRSKSRSLSTWRRFKKAGAVYAHFPSSQSPADLLTQKRGQNQGSDEEDINGENPGLYDSNGLSELERSLAHFRGILEKKYQNDHDSGYTYIDSRTGKSHPLSPQMMKEWSRSMVCQPSCPT